MKKFLCTLMAMALVLTSLCVPAFAVSYRLGDKIIASAIDDNPDLPDVEPYLYWSQEYARGDLFCEEDHEHEDECYDLVKEFTLCARQLYVGNKIKVKFDQDVENVVIWASYANGSSFDFLVPSSTSGSEFEVNMSSRYKHYISYDSSDKSVARVKRITVNYVLDNVFYTAEYDSWDDLYASFKSGSGSFVFKINAESEDGIVIGSGDSKARTTDETDTTESTDDAIVSAIANLIEEQSAANAEAETETATSALTGYCTAYDFTGYDYVVSDEDSNVTSATFCPICGQVSDGSKLTPIEHATVSGDEQEGELRLHMGDINSGDTVITACFTKNGEIVQPTGTVTITVPMDYPHALTLATKAADGTETALDYTTDDNGCISFSLTFEEGKPVALIYVTVEDDSDVSKAAM